MPFLQWFFTQCTGALWYPRDTREACVALLYSREASGYLGPREAFWVLLYPREPSGPLYENTNGTNHRQSDSANLRPAWCLPEVSDNKGKAAGLSKKKFPREVLRVIRLS